MVKLIRYANEAFEPYLYLYEDDHSPKFVNNADELEKIVLGCYTFVEEVDCDALTNIASKRFYETRNELLVSDDTLVWTDNIWPEWNDGKLKFKPYRIIENVFNRWGAWVQMSVGEIKERVTKVKENEGYVSYIFSECIFNVNVLNKR